MKISMLTFTYNNLDDALSNHILRFHNVINEFVIIDSSDEGSLKKFRSKLQEIGLANKVKIINLPLMGFVELYRALGVKEAKNKILLYLDTDETTSKEDIIKWVDILREENSAGLVIKRKEVVGGKYYGITYQIRFFRRDKVRYRGIIHELPIINGKIIKVKTGEIIHKMKEEFWKKDKLVRYCILESLQSNFSTKTFLMRRLRHPPFKLFGYNHSMKSLILMGFLWAVLGSIFPSKARCLKRVWFQYYIKPIAEYMKKRQQFFEKNLKEHIYCPEDLIQQLHLDRKVVWKRVSNIFSTNGLVNFIASLISYKKYGEKWYREISSEDIKLASKIYESLRKDIHNHFNFPKISKFSLDNK